VNTGDLVVSLFPEPCRRNATRGRGGIGSCPLRCVRGRSCWPSVADLDREALEAGKTSAEVVLLAPVPAEPAQCPSAADSVRFRLPAPSRRPVRPTDWGRRPAFLDVPLPLRSRPDRLGRRPSFLDVPLPLRSRPRLSRFARLASLSPPRDVAPGGQVGVRSRARHARGAGWHRSGSEADAFGRPATQAISESLTLVSGRTSRQKCSGS